MNAGPFIRFVSLSRRFLRKLASSRSGMLYSRRATLVSDSCFSLCFPFLKAASKGAPNVTIASRLVSVITRDLSGFLLPLSTDKLLEFCHSAARRRYRPTTGRRLMNSAYLAKCNLPLAGGVPDRRNVPACVYRYSYSR